VGASPTRWILHVDMDAFYASVEARDDPGLQGLPLIVGGTGRRGVVASCSYEARAYGVRSAMPTGQARRLCPNAVFVGGRFDRYIEASREMHAIFARFTPLVEGISLDEAFLDISGATRLFGPPDEIGQEIRRMVAGELGLSCSVGGATVKFLAKLASEAAKPRAPKPGQRGRVEGPGVVIVPPGGELRFLHPLPIEALWGVGPATAARLRGLGMATIGDLARVPVAALEGSVGRAAGHHLSQLARGLDDREVVPHRDPKSISHEETFSTDRLDVEGLRVEIMRMADSVATRMRKAGLVGRTLTMKIRYGDFTTITRSVTTSEPTDEAADISRLGCAILADTELGAGIRLLGVGMSNLSPPADRRPEQMSLELTGAPGPPDTEGGDGADERPVAQPPSSRPSATSAVDAIRARYGTGAVGPAALLGAGGLRVKRPGDTQWGPSQESEPPAR
jgi:DNA polymerase-4